MNKTELQNELNQLVERRISKVGELQLKEIELEGLREDRKSIQKELNAIDSLMKDKLEEINE